MINKKLFNPFYGAFYAMTAVVFSVSSPVNAMKIEPDTITEESPTHSQTITPCSSSIMVRELSHHLSQHLTVEEIKQILDPDLDIETLKDEPSLPRHKPQKNTKVSLFAEKELSFQSPPLSPRFIYDEASSDTLQEDGKSYVFNSGNKHLLNERVIKAGCAQNNYAAMFARGFIEEYIHHNTKNALMFYKMATSGTSCHINDDTTISDHASYRMYLAYLQGELGLKKDEEQANTYKNMLSSKLPDYLSQLQREIEAARKTSQQQDHDALHHEHVNNFLGKVKKAFSFLVKKK